MGWKRDDISTWIKRWGTLTAEAQEADAVTLAAAAAAAAVAKEIEEAEAAANATNGTQKFVILQSVAFRKVSRHFCSSTVCDCSLSSLVIDCISATVVASHFEKCARTIPVNGFSLQPNPTFASVVGLWICWNVLLKLSSQWIWMTNTKLVESDKARWSRECYTVRASCRRCTRTIRVYQL